MPHISSLTMTRHKNFPSPLSAQLFISLNSKSKHKIELMS